MHRPLHQPAQQLMSGTFEAVINPGMTLKAQITTTGFKRGLHWIPTQKKTMRRGIDQRPFTGMLPKRQHGQRLPE
ncbi:hypothetical protein SynMEDNS5_02007 [Synechococcus sp. MEDNS5]|nr:hypothetical protein SynMEDNS5_02007 [Synechococcus sp. MEDNS5]